MGHLVRDHRLEFTLFQPFRDFEGLPVPHRSRAFARAARKFDLMHQMGTDLALVCSSLHPAAMGGIDRRAADFSALGDLDVTGFMREAMATGCSGPPSLEIFNDRSRAGLPRQAARLAERGLTLLQIDENYWVDVEVRFGLDRTLVDRMRAARVPCDEDAGGSSFSSALHRAPTAPFRIAAQKRNPRPAGMPRH